VQLTANADPGFRFAAWSGDTVSAANPLQLIMNDNKTLTASFVENEAPKVTVVSPNGGETFMVEFPYALQWNATDNVGVTSVDLELSRTGPAGPFEVIAAGLSNDGSHEWFATGPETIDAYLRVVARDAVGNSGSDLGNAAFEIANPPIGVVHEPQVDLALALAPVWPNPARGRAEVEFTVPVESFVRVTILDLQGRRVADLAARRVNAGRHRLGWDGLTIGGRAAAGIYFVRLQADASILVRRFALVR